MVTTLRAVLGNCGDSVSQLSQATSALQARKVSMETEQAELEKMRETLSKMKIVAPESGLVV